MGKSVHHLHLNTILRYSSPRYFMGSEWIDTIFGQPPVWSKVEVEKEVVLKIKEEFLSQST